METDVVRKAAEQHAGAVVAGDLRTAARDLAPDARDKAGEVMQALPRRLDDASVDADAGVHAVRITYRGEGRAVTVRTRWEERETRPVIADLEIEA